jgi:hypothetical protein
MVRAFLHRERVWRRLVLRPLLGGPGLNTEWGDGRDPEQNAVFADEVVVGVVLGRLAAGEGEAGGEGLGEAGGLDYGSLSYGSLNYGGWNYGSWSYGGWNYGSWNYGELRGAGGAYGGIGSGFLETHNRQAAAGAGGAIAEHQAAPVEVEGVARGDGVVGDHHAQGGGADFLALFGHEFLLYVHAARHGIGGAAAERVMRMRGEQVFPGAVQQRWQLRHGELRVVAHVRGCGSAVQSREGEPRLHVA